MALSDQVTDSITQANTKVLGDAPAIAMGNLFIATAQALGNAAHNAVNSQQQTSITAQSATTQGVMTLLSIDTASTGVATRDIFGAPPASLAAVAEPPKATTAQAQDIATAAFKAALEAVDPMLTLVVLNAGALAMINAVEHLQRTAIVAEAATAMALARALSAPDAGGWKAIEAAAEQSVVQAAEHLETVCKLAIDMTRKARGGD